jgi:hypothetical protein
MPAKSSWAFVKGPGANCAWAQLQVSRLKITTTNAIFTPKYVERRSIIRTFGLARKNERIPQFPNGGLGQALILE